MEVFAQLQLGLAAPTTLLLPVLGHPRPRPRPRAKADHLAQWDHFRCPTGSYLAGGRVADRTPRLQRHLRQAFARGLLPSVLDAWPSRGSVNSSAFHTHESAAWPKPARCRTRRPEVCAVNPHFCLIMPNGNSPRVSLVSDRHGFEFRQVWKVASSSLASFFYCNMWGDLHAEKLLPTQQPPPPTKRAVVAPTREPIGRFVASAFEVLARLLSRVSPSGEQMPDHMYAEPGGPFSATVLSATTRWYAPLQKLVALQNASDAAAAAGAARPPPEVRQNALAAVVAGFVEDIECGVAYSAAEHLASQLSFVSAGHAERSHLDFQLRLNNVSADLERLRRVMRYRQPENASATAWKCALGRENSVEGKRLPLSKQEFEAILRADSALVQRLCTVYFQDFVCLGYPLPPECEGGRELAWLPPPPKEAAVEQARAALTEAFAAAAPSTL